ncbi:4750_t:CDS:2 [Diversispora eburnea]|uniref:4750_t:CDS:1 n=1 Tax=Diversispora eburnea TaxID=1213867 RepID=A0A9N9AMP9_9GLOM|nr:4750_t:CDS:2 [Diversispora eburnea]
MYKVVPSQIKNKIKREEIHAKQKQLKSRKKIEERLRRQKEEAEDPEKKKERLAKNIPRTLENVREFDETIVDAEDLEVLEDEASDEFSKYFQEGVSPKMLITTNKRPSKVGYDFASELIDVFPNSNFVRRKNQVSIKQIIEFCNNRNYTDILVVNEEKKGHGRSSCHKPELILNNFNTRLGHTIGRWFQALFPHVPEFKGRQAS